MCVSHAWSPPSSDPPFLSIVGLLVCPRIDVILRRLLQRFSFSFCWLCQFLLLPLSSILPPLNHIPWQAGRMDAVSARGGGILGSAASFGYFCRRFRPNFAGRGICLTSFSNVLLRFSFFLLLLITFRTSGQLSALRFPTLPRTLSLSLYASASCQFEISDRLWFFMPRFWRLLRHASHPAAGVCCKSAATVLQSALSIFV